MEAHPDTRSDLRKWGTPIRDELHEVFTDPVCNLADRIDDFVAENPEAVNKVANWRPVDRVPYSCHDLPPNLYEHSGATEPFIPASEYELRHFMDGFWQDNLRQHAETLGFHAHATFPEYRAWLTKTLRERREQDRQVDSEDWKTYQESYAAQLKRGFYTLGHNAAIMNIRSIFSFAADRGTFDEAAGRQDSYLMASLSSPHRIGWYLRVPEGEYGSEVAERLLRTTSFISDFIEQDRELSAELWPRATEHYEVLAHHTLRATVNSFLYGVEESSLVVVQEGAVSTLAMASLVMAQKIRGLEDRPHEVLARIAESDIINKLTLMLPLGVAGAASAFGIYFPNMMQANGQELCFDDDLRERLNRIRTKGIEIMHQEWKEYHDKIARGEEATPPVRTGLTCPVAGPHKNADGVFSPGAISRLTKTFRRVYEAIRLDSSATDSSGIPWNVPRIPLNQR